HEAEQQRQRRCAQAEFQKGDPWPARRIFHHIRPCHRLSVAAVGIRRVDLYHIVVLREEDARVEHATFDLHARSTMNRKGRIATRPPHRSLSVHGDSLADSTTPRVLMVTPQPFFEERGTPIAVAMTAKALVESGYAVDVLAFPVGTDPQIEGVRIERCANPFGFRQIRVGFSLRKALLDLSLLRSLGRLLSPRMYSVVHAVEEAAWLAAL